jgi:hypothetical protein
MKSRGEALYCVLIARLATWTSRFDHLKVRQAQAVAESVRCNVCAYSSGMPALRKPRHRVGSGVRLYGYSVHRQPEMSALGQKQTLRLVSPMSALPPKADIDPANTPTCRQKQTRFDSAFLRWDFFRKKLSRIKIEFQRWCPWRECGN